MTRKDREQVVELLRCAADLGMQAITAPLTEASYRLDARHLLNLADCAVDSVYREIAFEEGWPGFGAMCLEAAVRVEEGSWP